MFKNLINCILGVIVSFIIILVLAGCVKSQSKPVVVTLDQRKLLSTSVYNATVSHLESISIVDENDLSNLKISDFSYDQIQVVKGYAFKTTLESNLEPYFSEDYAGKEIEVVVSLFKLHSDHSDIWYDQQMIIFKTDTDIIGFLCPSMGQINDLNPIDVNLKQFQFDSAIFLTKTEVVKYYEKGDILYQITLDLSDETNIQLNISKCNRVLIDDTWEEVNNTVQPGSLIELGESEVLPIMESAIVNRVDVKATIDHIDEQTGLIYVTSTDSKTLETVELIPTNKIVDLNGNEISLSNLEAGDVIRIYYYERYSSYQPIHIRVYGITVEKIIELVTN